MLKDMSISALFTKVAIAVATAGTVGAGGALIKATTDNAVQDTRLETVETALGEVRALNENLQKTSTEVALLRQELEHQRGSRQ